MSCLDHAVGVSSSFSLKYCSMSYCGTMRTENGVRCVLFSLECSCLVLGGSWLQQI